MSVRGGRRGGGLSTRKNGASARRPAALTIRPARASDLVPLQFFFDTVLRKDYFLKRGQLLEVLSDDYHEVYIAEVDAILVGVAIVTRGACLVNVLVHPGYRALGIGRALVYASGACEVRAKTDVSSGDPRPFYQWLGFERTGEFNHKGNIEVLRHPARLAGNGRNGQRRSGRSTGDQRAQSAVRGATSGV